MSRGAFALLVLMACLTPSWEQGIFASLAVVKLVVAGRTLPLGMGVLLILVNLAGSAASWALATPRPRWRWGPRSTTIPVIGFGALALIRAWPIHEPAVALVTAASVGIFWGVYAFTVQGLPRRWIVGIVAALLAAQGLVAGLQFAGQRSVGLAFAGELALDPAVRGVSVIEAGGRRWLRAYGLTPHPNILGGYVGVGLLLALGALAEQPRRRWLWPGLALGGVAFFFTFSRAAWLGFAAALAYGALVLRPWQLEAWRAPRVRRRLWIGLGVLAALLAVGGLTFGELVAARLLRLDRTLEANSIRERVRDAGQAWMLIRHLPLRGVGTGYYVQALWAWANTTGRDFPAFQPVHNIPLLATAEMGLGGPILWLWLLGAPPLALLRSRASRRASRRAPLEVAWAATFVLLFVVSLLDYYLYIPTTWWPSIYLGLLLGGWARGPDGETRSKSER